MADNLEKYLLEAAGKDKYKISSDNPYRNIGFDEDKGRLGWVRVTPFSRIKESLENISFLIKDKESIIFVGMGGSINGIKPLLLLFKTSSFCTLDNLDPDAFSDAAGRIKDFEKTLVVAISKSGTTRETQFLSSALKELFSYHLGEGRWQKHFLWLSDISSFEKLNALGWSGVKKIPIQFDEETDIGGRFSSPHTLIFFLPLFLLLNKDFDKLKDIYDSFVLLQKEIREKAYLAYEKYKDKPDAYFYPLTEKKLGESFSSWIVQLFQESLGSKLDGLAVKTLTNADAEKIKLFSPLKLDLKINSSVVSLMCQMYFFQIFIAYYSACRGIKFVTQDFVEKYKHQMHALEKQNNGGKYAELMYLDDIMGEVKKNICSVHRFIEIVLYFYPKPEIIDWIKNQFSRVFERRVILVFIGNDWNHQSYQAAFGGKDTFYVLLISSSGRPQIPFVSAKTLKRNVDTLSLIAKATHLTLSDKSLLFSLAIP